LVLLFLVGSHAVAQRGAAPRPISQPVAREMAAEYRQLIEQFLQGDSASAVHVVKTWQVTSVEAVQDVQPWDRTTLRAAAMLETDAALAIGRDVVWVAGRPLPPSQSRTFQDVGSRLTLAIRWLELADKIRPADDSGFRRRWQVAVGRLLLWNGFAEHAEMILGDASILFPNDPDVLLAYGTVREAAALNLRPDLGWVTGSAQGGYGAQNDRGMLQGDARRVFTRALRTAPASSEAKLRLAHIRLLQHEDGDASALLNELNASPPSAGVSYVAALLLGRIRERQNDLKGAVDSYQNAQRLLAGPQSASIAFAHALYASGRFREAVETLRDMLTQPTHVADPWALYALGLDQTKTSLDGLRNEVRQQPPPVTGQAPPVEKPVVNPGASFDLPLAAPESTNAVVLDVLVTRDEQPVTGLRAADFDVRHDDARQQVELVEIDSLPIDVRLVVDVNGLSRDHLTRVKTAATALVTQLRPADRAELLIVSDEIRLGAGLTSERQVLAAAIDRIADLGTSPRYASPRYASALVDAAFTALALPTSPGRRTLLVIYATGRDSASWLSATDIIDLAAMSSTVVYGVRTPEPEAPVRNRSADVGQLRRWLYKEPFLLREAMVPVLADTTGGELLHPVSVNDLPATFISTLARFQQRYRLRYTPDVSQKSDRHVVEVRMKDRTMRAVARPIYQVK
jgi:VWFA-related protein